MKLLTRAEETLLLIIWRLQHDAYGVKIREMVETQTGQQMAFGAIFVTLDRMVKNDLLSSYLTEPTAERGGRSKRIYQLTSEGKKALVESRKVQNNLWDGIDDLSLETK